MSTKKAPGRPAHKLPAKIKKMLGVRPDPKVAEAAGVSVATVYRWRKAHGISEYRLVPDKVRWTNPVTGKTYRGLPALKIIYREQKGRGLGRACKKLGIPESAGYRWSQRLDLKWKRGRPKAPTSDLRQRMVMRLRPRFSFAEIGRVLDLSPQRVKQIAG